MITTNIWFALRVNELWRSLFKTPKLEPISESSYPKFYQFVATLPYSASYQKSYKVLNNLVI